MRLARVSNWSLSSTVEALETTDLGQDDRTYRSGLKGSTGSCSIWYHDKDPVPLLKRVVHTGEAKDTDIVRFSLRWGQQKIDVDALITNANLACQVGAVMQAQLSFNIIGDFQEVEL